MRGAPGGSPDGTYHGSPGGTPDEAAGAAGPALMAVPGGQPPHGARAAVLLLHGGRADALEPPTRLNLPARRMRPFAAALVRATADDGVLVARVRYRHRGWNGPHAHPVADVHRALDELRALTGPVPVVLVGHSLGGRAALRAAGDPQVLGVVALAPWCPPGDPTEHLRGRTVVALHDEADRVTRAADTWACLTRAHAAGARVVGIRMPAGGHAMIRRAGLWHRITAGATAALLGTAPCPSLTGDLGWTGSPRPAPDPPARRAVRGSVPG
ncbi:alpha/beta fold hydrolase [Streptomyces sp. NPDC008265]|uniref:alpha/beta hydrolase n=1 Tax=Streptomyces sp. NPDC008265 TaxID=3364824 RepID=UPI0036E128E9